MAAEVATRLLVDEVRGRLAPKLEAVETALVRHLDDCPDPLREAALGILRAGGKRLRPLLLLLASDLVGYHGEDDVLHAAVVEYVHVASLLHDDVIDEADLRRGRPTLNRRLGNTLSVLVGDYLCMKALAMTARGGHRAVLHLISRTTLDLVEGEALQEAFVGRLDVTEAECLRAIELKTGRLMAAACQVPALLAGSPHGPALREYGLQVGLAFQLADDILDYESDEATLGKPVLADLREGKLSLPAILALEMGGAETRAVIARVLEDGDFTRVGAEEVTAAVRGSGGVAAATARAREAADRARAALADLPPGPARDGLDLAAVFAVDRKF